MQEHVVMNVSMDDEGQDYESRMRLVEAGRILDRWIGRSKAMAGAVAVAEGSGMEFRERMEQALADAGVCDGGDDGLLEALCLGRPQRGLAFSKPMFEKGGGSVPYQCVIDAVRLWGEGVDPLKVGFMSSYDESTIHRSLPGGWGDAREGLFLRCVRDADADSITPAAGDVKTGRKSDGVVYCIVQGGRLGVADMPVGDVYYDMWHRMDDPFSVLRRAGWERMFKLMSLSRYGVDGGNAKWCLGFVLECLDGHGLQGFDAGIEALRMMRDGQWHAPKPTPDDICNGLPLAFNVENMKAEGGDPATYVGNSDEFRSRVCGILDGYFTRSLEGKAPDRIWWQILGDAITWGRSGINSSISRRVEILDDLSLLERMDDRHRDALGPWFSGAVNTAKDFLNVFSHGVDGLFRCSALMILDANLDDGRSMVSADNGMLSLRYISKRGFSGLPKAYREYIAGEASPDRALPKRMQGFLSSGDTAESMLGMIESDPEAHDIRTLVEHACRKRLGRSVTEYALA